jgi:two-component system phosphate regulon sensor histidine kinase PhoR
MGRSWTFWRLFASIGLPWLFSLGLLGAVIVSRADRFEREQIGENLRARARLVREVVRRHQADPQTLQAQVVGLGRETGMRITLVGDDGRVVADSDEDPGALDNHGERPEIVQAREGADGVGTDARTSRTSHRRLLYVAVRADGAGPEVAFVRVARPLDEIEERIAGLKGVVWTAAGFTAVAALGLAFWLAGRTARPLRELTEAARRIAEGAHGQKVFAAGRDEVADLARTFNHMSARLAVQFAQLEEDRQQLRAILSGMVEGVIALDAQERILFVNDRAAQLLEFKPQAAVGRRLWEVVRLRSLSEVVRRALTDPQPHSEELRWSGAALRSLTVHAARLATGGGDGGGPRGAVLVLHDTTELRRLERMRQDFVANVSHELKTPLSVIKVCIETLLDGAVDDVAHRGAFLERVADQADRLHALILDLLSLARIESGEEAFELEAVPLEPAVHNCLDRHRARAGARRQVLGAEPPPDGADLAAWVDEEALGQILDNLVDNAVKYTPEGSRITVRWRAEDGAVCLEVEDNGQGIPAPDLPRIFERFYRVDKARSREMGGTGLGLSIVKHLVQAMKGTVRASSRVGQGTTFAVRLPRGPARDEPARGLGH